MAMINFPYGIKLSQSYNELGFWLEFIHQTKVKAIVELGVHVGGFAAQMITHKWWNPGQFDYLGVENIAHGINPLVRERGRFIIGDCFTVPVFDQVKAWVHQHGPTIIFCDNGQKNRELEFYAPVCRPGDFIFAHDYKSEVFDEDLEFLRADPTFIEVDNITLVGTTLRGFKKR